MINAIKAFLMLSPLIFAWMIITLFDISQDLAASLEEAGAATEQSSCVANASAAGFALKCRKPTR
jgi:hypothetical protein